MRVLILVLNAILISAGALNGICLIPGIPAAVTASCLVVCFMLSHCCVPKNRTIRLAWLTSCLFCAAQGWAAPGSTGWGAKRQVRLVSTGMHIPRHIFQLSLIPHRYQSQLEPDPVNLGLCVVGSCFAVQASWRWLHSASRAAMQCADKAR